VAEVDVDSCRIDSVLNAKRRPCFQALLQLPGQFFFRHDFFDAAADNRKLIFDRWKLHGGMVDRELELMSGAEGKTTNASPGLPACVNDGPHKFLTYTSSAAASLTDDSESSLLSS
jgi:hypothetical protein